MEFKQLRYFLAIAEHGSFSRAAGKVFVAQSALSHQIAQLESEIGAPLFHRSRRGVELTEGGELFHAYALSILRQVEDARNSVTSMTAEPAGKVIFGIPHSISNALALPLIQAIRDELPKVSLELTEELTGNLTRQLNAGTLHMAILFNDGHLNDFIVEPLVSERMSLIFRPDQPHEKIKASMTFREALTKPLILPAQPHGVRPIIEQEALKRGLPAPNVVADISSISILRSSLLAGLGQTILPAMPMKTDIDSGALCRVPLRSPTVSRVVALCRSRHIPISTAAAAVNAITIRVMQDLCNKKKWVDATFIG